MVVKSEKDAGSTGTTLVLPSGITVVMKKGKMRHMLTANKIAGNEKENVIPALISVLCTFDGQVKVMEDVLDMELTDSMPLFELVGNLISPNSEAQNAPS